MPEEHNTKTKTGPTAILEALRGLDLDKLEAEAREGLKTGSKTSRGRYTKALNAIRGLKRTGVEPHELMVTSIPVIPPKFRPFAQQGDTLIPGDANTLYKDFIEQNDAFREELGMFGSENAGRGRLDLYDAAKALYGYGDPTKEKSRQKDVRGFLKKLTGRTSKTGYFQSKLVAKPMDSVGRSTIIVNPELSMDEIGIPVDMALTMYAPHIQRRLRQSGMPDSDALKAVRDRTPAAVRALEEEVKTRPVVYSRAPAWWKHNVLSGKVRLTEGDAISISPATTTPLNADFDGNCVIGSTKLVIKIDTSVAPRKSPAKSAFNSTVNNDYDKTNVKISIDESGRVIYDDGVMTNATLIAKTAEGAVASLRIEDMPHIKSTVRKDKNGADVYDVPDGISVLASTPEGGVRWESVESFTVEDGCDLRKVVTSGGKVVECSANESLAAFNPDGGLQRIKPDDAVKHETKVDKAGNEYQDVYFAHAVPVVNKYPCRGGEGDDLDGILGWLIGAFVSDGTFDGNLFTYTKDDTKLRTMVMASLARLAGSKDIMACAKTYSEMHDAETNYGIGGMSTKIHIKAGALPEWLQDIFMDCYDQESLADRAKRSCLAKRLPGDVTGYSRKKLLGVLAGFLDGDGSISLNRSKKTPQVLCSICTSSTYLRDSVKLLFNMLGIPFRYSVTKPANGRVQRHDNYVIPVSTEWLYAHMDELPVATTYKALEHLRNNPPHCSARNRTPMSYKAMLALREANPEVTKWKAWATNLSKCKRGGYILFARDNAQKYAQAIKDAIPEWKARPELACVVNAAFDEATRWEYYDTVERIPTERVYDIGVPGAKVFMLESGLIVYDTINVHVPATDEAVKEAFDVLMPSASPYIDRTGDAVVTKLKQEQVLGMHNSALRPSAGTYRFKNEQEALAAVKRGDVPLEADLEIDGFNPKPGNMAKAASGKMMEVGFKNLEQSGEVGERRTKGIVYMPDCEEYRDILAGDDREAKAKLVQKFVLNQAPGVVYAACDAYVVE